MIKISHNSIWLAVVNEFHSLVDVYLVPHGHRSKRPPFLPRVFYFVENHLVVCRQVNFWVLLAVPSVCTVLYQCQPGAPQLCKGQRRCASTCPRPGRPSGNMSLGLCFAKGQTCPRKETADGSGMQRPPSPDLGQDGI